MSTTYTFTVSSIVPATQEAVWERVTTFEGVNDELMPVVRMTCPPELRRIDPATVPLGRPWFRSWLLLFGVVPFDYDHLCLVAIDPPRRFHESSTMLSQRRWIHERHLDPVDAGTRVTDRVEFEPRLPFLGRASRRVFERVFRHRHRNLLRHFAEQAARPRSTIP